MAGRPGHWLADPLRLAAGLFTWNLRKTLYVRRGRRGRCPCQNESDDSIPGRVRCDAVLFLHEPGRFRQVCPLLVATEEGWRCSVHASQVRPFWGRTLRFSGLALLAAYLGLTLVAWVALRGVARIPVSWSQVAWPGGWAEIPRLQSEHLFGEAVRAFQAGNLTAAHLALATARVRNPDHYEATLLLAQIEMFQFSHALSDEMFAELQRRHPAQAYRTAVVYHDTLLGMDRPQALAEHCFAMAASDPAHAAVWIRSALLAIRSLRPTEVTVLAEKLPRMEAGLAEHARRLVRAELDWQTGARDAALTRLREPFPGPFNPFYIEHQIIRLAELGQAGEAQALLDRQGPLLGEFDQLRVQTALARLAGDDWGARAAFSSALKLAVTGPQLNRLAALLITHPDRELYLALHRKIRQEPKLTAAAVPATLWITGIVCEALPEARSWREDAGRSAPGGWPDIGTVDFTRRDVLKADTANHLINVVSFPREVIQALLGRSAPQKETGRWSGR
jgi:hypothetical protein